MLTLTLQLLLQLPLRLPHLPHLRNPPQLERRAMKARSSIFRRT